MLNGILQYKLPLRISTLQVGSRSEVGSFEPRARLITRTSAGVFRTPKYNITLTLTKGDSTTRPGSADGSQSIITALDMIQNSKMLALVGEPFSATTISSALVSSRFYVPQCSPTASTDDLSNKASFTFFFRTTGSNGIQGAAIVKGMMDTYGWKRFGVAFTRCDRGFCLPLIYVRAVYILKQSLYAETRLAHHLQTG